jgi:hypothetical protein
VKKLSEDNKESSKEKSLMKDDLEDELEKQWEMQDKIHKPCKMKGDSAEKQDKWKEKYN